MRREILPPWVDVRLTFPDGARVDVLAVVRDGRMAIEDAQADPPLTLEDFAALAGVIDSPLQDAWQVVADRHRPAERLPATEIPTADVPAVEIPAMDIAAVEPPTVQPLAVRPVPQAPLPEDPALHAPAVVDAALEEPADDGPALDEPAVDEPADPPGRHRARSTPPRGPAGRMGAAEVYRAAQRDGVDPVLAVMAATGLSRRKSLRLIAGARDEGHLSPRHNRR
ncbi:hypothetical protein HY68_30975 [Streptomyces sp. AcH 505]|uniref:DUF6214 family protein n=1 Tax=Streptomyces sp. AcH 505 TaxID=352211 RepID=UPI00059195B0|nr:hypothetical protein HY68_30975 [Streptomyces sp. AcH 505]